MAKCVDDFEWQSVGGDAIANLIDSEIEAMFCSVVLHGERRGAC